MAAPAALAAPMRVVEHEWLMTRRLWQGVVFSMFVSPLLMLGAMGLGLGGLVDDGAGVGGTSYLEFVAPGLLAATLVQAAVADSLWPIMAGTTWLRTFHAMVATPLRPRDVQRGLVLWQVMRSSAIASVFLVVAAVLGGISSPWGVLALPAAVLGAVACAAPVAAFAATRETDVSFSLLMRLGVTPVFFFSGVFFPVGELPDALERLIVLSPLFHAVELCRAAASGTASVALVGHVAVLGALLVAGLRWGERTFERRLGV